MPGASAQQLSQPVDSKVDVDLDRRATGFIGMYVKEHLLNVVNEHKSAVCSSSISQRNKGKLRQLHGVDFS
jgi:hypothetical protein